MIGRFPVGPTSLQQVLSGEIWGTASVAETTSGFVDVWERESESQHVKRRLRATGEHSNVYVKGRIMTLSEDTSSSQSFNYLKKGVRI